MLPRARELRQEKEGGKRLREECDREETCARGLTRRKVESCEGKDEPEGGSPRHPLVGTHTSQSLVPGHPAVRKMVSRPYIISTDPIRLFFPQWTYPFHSPDHAPVADPGLTKNLCSNSNASNLSCQPELKSVVQSCADASEDHAGSGLRPRDCVHSPMRPPAHQHIYIHLPSQRR